MPPNERSQVPDVVPSARALFQRIQALALSLADIERTLPPGSSNGIEQEISALEAAANPLDRVGSEGRVRRLAQLKRQRRALGDILQRREAAADRLETCVLALQNMRFDVLRLRAGAQTHAHITSLALDAMNLAKEIDTALYVADEMAKLGERPPLRTSGPRAAERA
jgi:serine/threonine-protein kinase